MRTTSDVERFLNGSGLKYQDLGDGLFIVGLEATSPTQLAIKVADDVVVFQLKALETPEKGAKGREQLLEDLLRLNASGVLHSAFALQDDGIYLQAALPLQNLDANEMQAVLDDIGLAVSQHIPKLAQGLSK